MTETMTKPAQTPTVAYRIRVKGADGKTKHPEITFKEGLAFTTSSNAAEYATDMGWDVETIDPAEIPASFDADKDEEERKKRDYEEVQRDIRAAQMHSGSSVLDGLDDFDDDGDSDDDESTVVGDDTRGQEPTTAPQTESAAEDAKEAEKAWQAPPEGAPSSDSGGENTPVVGVSELKWPDPTGETDKARPLEELKGLPLDELARAAGFSDGQWTGIEARLGLENAHGNRVNAVRRRLMGFIREARTS